MLTGRQAAIHADRDGKLEEARQQRQLRRRRADFAVADPRATEPFVNHGEGICILTLSVPGTILPARDTSARSHLSAMVAANAATAADFAAKAVTFLVFRPLFI
jgi:hypothetical protein